MSGPTTTFPRVLVLGGNGNVAKLMTRLMLAKGWHVISVVRAPSQSASLSVSLGSTNSGHLDFRTVDFLSTTSSSAKDLLQDARPDIIVWAAASMPQPRQIDGAAAKAYIAAGASLPTVKKILSISAYSARRKAAPWCSKADAEYWKHEVTSYPDIANAKTDADEHLIAWGNKRAREGDATFQAIAVRPVWYGSGGNGSEGKVVVGKTPARGTVRREDVARLRYWRKVMREGILMLLVVERWMWRKQCKRPWRRMLTRLRAKMWNVSAHWFREIKLMRRHTLGSSFESPVTCRTR